VRHAHDDRQAEDQLAAHLYVYLAVLALGLATLYLALTGTEQSEPVQADELPPADEHGEASA
jgi:hypothetical protein